jgi:hypothetical protein
MVFHKVPYCLLPYTISSQPICPRATRVELPHLRLILRSLCPAEILGCVAINCNDTSILFPRTSMEDKIKRGQDPGNIFLPMLVYIETANCSYQCWGPTYPMVHRSKIPWGYPRQETHTVPRPGLSRNRRKLFSIGSGSLMCIINYHFPEMHFFEISEIPWLFLKLLEIPDNS